MRNSKSISLLSLLFGVATLGCKSAPPVPPPATPAAAVTPAVAKVQTELKLAPAQAASESLGMSLLVASPMKLVADLDKISKDLQLPMPLGQSLLPLLTSGAGPGGMRMDAEALERLDATRPLSVIWLVRGAQQPVGWCGALAFKEEKFAQQSLKILGAVTEERAGAKQIKTPSGEMVWAAAAQRQLLLSDTPETLLSGGALAIATQTTPVLGQVLFTINPAIMAKSTGQSLDALSAALQTRIVAEMEKAQPKKALTPASKKLAEGMLKAFFPALSQIAVARLSLELGSQHGILLRAEVQPTKGSSLAEKMARVSPYAFDSALPVSSDASAAMAWGDVKGLVSDWANVIEQSSASGKAMAKALRAYMDSVNGGSCAADLATPKLATLCSMTVRPGVKPAQVLEQYVSFVRASNEWEAELEARKPRALKIKRAGKMVEIEKDIERKDPKEQAMMKALFGGAIVHIAIEPLSDRVVLAMGDKPRELLKKYGKGRDLPAGAALLNRALLDSAGADIMGFVDVMALLNKILGASKDVAGPQVGMMMSAVPGLAELRAPMVMAGSGGNIPALELQIPFGTLQNVARVVSGFMGAMGPAPGK
jgi:hypothetical protein